MHNVDALGTHTNTTMLTHEHADNVGMKIKFSTLKFLAIHLKQY